MQELTLAERTRSTQGEGLSLTTLVIAAVSSGAAAVIVSHFWQSGTVIAAAMTPVCVSIVREALQRPMKSDVVRRSASRVTDVATARRALAGAAAARTEGARRRSPAEGAVPPPRPPADPELTQGDVLLTHPRRVYGSSNGTPRGLARLRGRPLKVAIVTGVLAFAVAAVVMTVPELVFGGAVSSHHRTTLFGGGSKSSQKSDKQDSNGSSDQSQQQDQQNGQTQPQQQTPTDTTPSQTPTQTQPDQTQPPAQQAPAPSGGASPAQPAPSTPSP